LIHILSVSSNYRHLGACRGHSSQVRNLDFSQDGSAIRSCDASKELLYWDVDSVQRITQPNIYRNLRWKTHSCIFGWGLQGIFNRSDGEKLLPPDSEINCIGRAFNGKILVAAGSNMVRSAIKAFDYPVLSNAMPNQYGGHSSPVLDLAFIDSDRGSRLVSAGGNDSCVFLWDIIK
jgi:WD40 repeat protein